MSARRRYQRFVAWLSIVAIGLLTVAPTVSRLLEAQFSNVAIALASEEICSVHHFESDHGHPAGDPSAPPSTDACGYCSLISHSPAALATAITLPPALPAAAIVSPAIGTDAPSATPISVHSRGPPVA